MSKPLILELKEKSIKEKGHNSNGTYVKYEDGTLIQFGKHTYNVNTTETYYNLGYRSGEDYFGKEEYPIPFTELDSLNIEAIAQGLFHIISLIKRNGNVNKLTNLPALTFVSPTNNSNASKVDCYFYAVGKWK